MKKAARAAVVSGIAWSVLAGSVPATLAVTEEFSTFDVALQEEDDESLLDHFLTRTPRAWREEWRRAPQAIRSSQGCLTSGQWIIDTDLKVRAPMGRRARFAVDLRQFESDEVAYDHLDFSVQFPTAYGAPGLLFRPFYDKSRQDVALTWETGTDTSTYQLRVVFTLEDLFNNLWEFRQTRVGQESKPYTRHPYEPGLYFATRHERWRAEIGGHYLTPSVKRTIDPTGNILRVASLWGAVAHASFGLEAWGLEWEAHGFDRQATSTDYALLGFTGRHRVFRRRWTAETSVRRRVTSRLSMEALALYQERTQDYGPPVGPAHFNGIDRMWALEGTYAIVPTLTGRLGLLRDRVTIDQVGTTPMSWGTRTETRLYFGLLARFGRVSLSGVEGIELDREPYDVWGVHDKGFLHLQATF